MSADSRFEAPRTLARALAELARRAGGEHAREAELRAALPASMGSWLHGRLDDVRLQGATCTLVLRDASGAREAEALADEILRELRRRLGPEAPARLRVERGRGAPVPAPRERTFDPASSRPLVAEGLEAIEDPETRARLARWAGVSIDPAQGDGR